MANISTADGFTMLNESQHSFGKLQRKFCIELLLSVSRLLYLGSQFFIELLLSVEQNVNRRFS